MNDSLYNPDTMSKEEIKALFVARQPLLDELVSTIKNQPKGAGVQHLLIIAPRGMGKTTMLLMLQFAVEDQKELSKNWQAVRFPEESYDITELADFWLKVLDYLDDESLKSQIEEIERRFTNSEDLREAAWALVKDWSKNHKKRIVLLVDNFDMILDQIGNNTEQARLRDILMNDGTVMLIGCSPSYFHQIQDYGQPLYNFFKTFNLNDLKFPDIEELLRRRAELDDIPNIDEILKKNKTRIKALETFTGGNPRLVLMLYRIITSSDMLEVRKGLEKLLDAVTPYYKDKTEKLPPQQRKIINEIAQYSLEKNEGISPTEIAKKIRMTPNQVSSQLKRLSENGYVRALNIRGRSSFYVLSEPLYAIWAQMRFGRNAREKRNWLVQILKALYDVQEIQKEIEKLDKRVKKLKVDGRENKAKGVLEYMVCLLETNPLMIQKNFSLAISSYLDLDEKYSVEKIIKIGDLNDLPVELMIKLHDQKLLDQEDLNTAVNKMLKIVQEKTINEFIEAENLYSAEKYTESLKKLDKILEKLNTLETKKFKKHKTLRKLFSLFDFINAKSYRLKGNILAYTETSNKASYFYNQSLKILDDLLDLEFNIDIVVAEKSELLFVKLSYSLVDNNSSIAGNALAKYIETVKKYNFEDSWLEKLTVYLTKLTKVVGLSIIYKTIFEAKAENEFFPLIRAIDYLKTKDESILEKLSPEVRIVVEETIKTLQMVSEETEVAQ